MNSPSFLSLSHYPEQGTVYSQWLRTVDSTEYRQSLLSVFELIRKSNASHWLVDLTKTTSPNISDQNWATHLLGDKLQHTHIRKVAFVLPNDLFLEVVVEKVSSNLIKMTNNKIQFARFSNLELAQQWIESRSDLEGLFRSDSPITA